MARLWSAILLAAFALTAQERIDRTPEPKPTWAGIYSFSGQENAQDYVGVAQITKIGPYYGVVMACGPSVIKGVAQGKGDSLCIGWSEGKGTGSTVITKGEGGLTARWCSIPGNGELAFEKWELLKKSD